MTLLLPLSEPTGISHRDLLPLPGASSCQTDPLVGGLNFVKSSQPVGTPHYRATEPAVRATEPNDRATEPNDRTGRLNRAVRTARTGRLKRRTEPPLSSVRTSSTSSAP